MDFLSSEKHLKSLLAFCASHRFPCNWGKLGERGSLLPVKKQCQEKSGNILEELSAFAGCAQLQALIGKASSGKIY